jgi:hypothetical protein
MAEDNVNAKRSVEELKLRLEIVKLEKEAEQEKQKTAEANAKAEKEVEQEKQKTAEANAKAEKEAEQEKQKTEQEKQKTAEATAEAAVKVEQEKQKTLMLELQCKIRATDEGRKRFKIDSNGNVTISRQHYDSLNSSLTNSNYYKHNVENNIHGFGIPNILQNYNDVNEAMVDVIKENFNQFESVENIPEAKIQTTFNKLLSDLFSQLNSSTSLKYLDTHGKHYLKGKASDDISSSKASDYIVSGKSPDCSFIYKNVNIDVQGEHESLQDFVVCIGELKASGTSKGINGPDPIGQLMRYLACILKVQKRGKVYGFLTDINNIRFYYAEQNENQSIVYYQSDNFEMFNYSSKTTTTSSTRCYNEETLKLFIKFLTMEMNFYGYTTLNINTKDYLYDDIFYIKKRFGTGATSFVYLLKKTCNNQSANHPKYSIIKISKHEKYSDYFLNEVDILQKLKESNSSKNFDLFFENVLNSSPTGKIYLLKSIYET